MSAFDNNSDNNNSAQQQHRPHDPTQPFPDSSVRGRSQTHATYPPSTQQPVPPPAVAFQQGAAGQVGGGPYGQAGVPPSASGYGVGAVGQGEVPEGKSTAFSSERPLGVAPAPEGGVAIGGQANLPEGHAGLGDKLLGKTEKIVGKASNKPEMHERGELRETGGKAAAEGYARAAHD